MYGCEDEKAKNAFLKRKKKTRRRIRKKECEDETFKSVRILIKGINVDFMKS
jgi:hypothetical protein